MGWVMVGGGDQNAHQEISVPRLYPETSGVQIAGDNHITCWFYWISGGRTRDRTLDLSRV